MKFRAIVLFFSIIAAETGLFAGSSGAVSYGVYGARNVGLGGANGAAISDPSALMSNPAGIASINGEDKTQSELEKEAKETFDSPDNPLPEGFWENDNKDDKIQSERSFELQFYSTYGQMTLDRYVVYSGIGMTMFGGTLGVGFLGSMVTGIQGYDTSGNATQSLDYQYGNVIVGYAREAGSFSYGISVNGIQEILGTSSIYGGGISIGAQMAPLPMFALGAYFKNIVGMYQRSVGENSYEKLDTEMDLSVSVAPPATNLKFMLSFNSNLGSVDNTTEIRSGVIFYVTKAMFLMGGLNNGNFSFGAGLELSFLHFSYAINQDPLRTGFQHFLDLNFLF